MIVLDLTFLATALLVVPWLAHRSFPDAMRMIVGGAADARITGYRRTVLWQWAMCAVGFGLWAGAGRSLERLGFAPPEGAGFWTALAIAGVIAGTLQAQLLAVRGSDDARREARSQLGGSLVLLPRSRAEGRAFFRVSLTAGICEEVLYRGWLLGWLAPRIGLPAAFVLGVLLFTLAHSYGGRSIALRAGALGVVLSALYVLSGSLWVPIALHVFLDANAGQLSVAAHSDAPVPQPETVT